MREELEKKVKRAIKLIQSAVGDDVVEVSYSGGKDSDVILELTKMAGVKYRAIYKNTTIDPPGTIKHCQDNGVEIFPPKIPFFKLVEKKGMPTRRARFCCEFLKEYKVLDKAIQGIRRSESAHRKKNYSEEDPVICRIYGSKKNHVSVILPILSWTDQDVAEFIEERGIKCHPLYYEKVSGGGVKFHPERRLGCFGCPMSVDAGRSAFRKNPKFFKILVKHVKIWWDTHPNTSSRKKFGTVYGMIANNIFFKSYQDYLDATNTVFGTKDWKRELELYFNIKLP